MQRLLTAPKRAPSWADVANGALDTLDHVALHSQRWISSPADGAAVYRATTSALDDPAATEPLAWHLARARRVALVVPDARSVLSVSLVESVIAQIDAFAHPEATITGVVAGADGFAAVDDGLRVAPHIEALRAHGVHVVTYDAIDDAMGSKRHVEARFRNFDLILVLHRIHRRVDRGYSSPIHDLVVGCSSAAEAYRYSLAYKEVTTFGSMSSPLLDPILEAQAARVPNAFSVIEARTASEHFVVAGDPFAATCALVERVVGSLKQVVQPAVGALIRVGEGEGASLDSALESLLLLSEERASPLRVDAPVLLVADCSLGVAPGEFGRLLAAELGRDSVANARRIRRTAQSECASLRANRILRAASRYPLAVCSPWLGRLPGVPFLQFEKFDEALVWLNAAPQDREVGATKPFLVLNGTTEQIPWNQRRAVSECFMADM